ncbi:MinD/ParA family ATP-binding protein [Halomicrococcus gelatinilyticus]|uniref:MinD/ParA family ATP-binding protein n=1 Tax=Halomicrococcus gelatinilyticus TaxID=1702103 RepID=UPI002E123F72
MLAVAGGKGGCGKTTTTLGLATALAATGRSVLAVDADREMPDLHVLADVAQEPNLADLAPESGDPLPASEVAHPLPDRPGVRVVPAAPSAGSGATLPTACARFDAAADRVLLDCPAGGGEAAAAALRVADRALLVSTPTLACLRDAATTAAMARALGATVVGAVLTRAERVPDGVERLLGCPVLATVPAVDRSAGTATPVLGDDAVSAAYDRVAATLLSKHL